MPQLGLGLGINLGNVLSPYTAEYQAVLNLANTNGYTVPSVTEQMLQNQLIIDLKKNGIWDKLDAFYMFANNVHSGATYSGLNFARINWKNPSSYLSTAGTWGYPTISAAAGFTGTSSSNGGSLNLNLPHIVSGNNFNSSGASMGVLFGDIDTLSSAVLGTTGTQSRIRKGSSSSQIATSTIVATYTANSFVFLNRTEVTTPSLVRTIVAYIKWTYRFYRKCYF